MHVVIATYTFHPEIGGVATTEGNLASAFLEAGHDVTIVTLAAGPTNGFPYRVVRSPTVFQLFRLYWNADILVQANLSLALIYPLVLIWRPFALRHHSESAFQIPYRPFLSNLIRRWIRSRARHMVTSQYIGELSGFREYTVTPPSADPEFLNSRIINDPKDRRDIVFVGRVEPEKGIPFLLERWPSIRRSLGVDQLRIVGDGSLSRLVQSAIASGLNDVTFTGALPKSEVAEEMGRAAYVIVPSIWQEPFGAVALEAVAAGAIPIVADRGGLREAAGDLGMMYNPDDEASFDAALRAARQTREVLLSSSGAWEKYRLRMMHHVNRYEPSRVVRDIICAMKPPHRKL